MPNLGAPEIILILVVLLLLFGAKRLPDLTRSVGRSMRIFKSEVKDMRDDDDDKGTTKAHRDEEPRQAHRDEEPRRSRELEGRVVEPQDDPVDHRVTEPRHREP